MYSSLITQFLAQYEIMIQKRTVWRLDGTTVTSDVQSILRHINPLKPTGNYMHHLLYQSVIVYSVFMSLVRVSMQTTLTSWSKIFRIAS
jgi:hypothetical protein